MSISVTDLAVIGIVGIGAYALYQKNLHDQLKLKVDNSTSMPPPTVRSPVNGWGAYGYFPPNGLPSSQPNIPVQPVPLHNEAQKKSFWSIDYSNLKREL